MTVQQLISELSAMVANGKIKPDSDVHILDGCEHYDIRDFINSFDGKPLLEIKYHDNEDEPIRSLLACPKDNGDIKLTKMGERFLDTFIKDIEKCYGGSGGNKSGAFAKSYDRKVITINFTIVELDSK